MRYISSRKMSEGMLLAKPIYDEFGRILLSKGTVLTAPFIDKLLSLGVSGIYIDDALSADVEIDEPISPELRSAGIDAVRQQDINSCLLICRQIVEEIVKKGKVSFDMMDLRTYDNYTFEHSVSVAVLACTVGFGMNLKQKDLEDLVLAGLLHDLGKLGIPEEILNKPGRLTPEEFALIKAHPQMSYDLIKDRIDISAMTKNAVVSHHENYDGSGYPRQLAGNAITVLARILHVADVYDALVSQRPYKKPYSPFAAVEILQGGSGVQYDPEVVKAFLQHVPIYPKGTEIEIEGKMKGIVIENSGIHNLRPIVRLEDKTEIDLSTAENYSLEITNPSDEDYFAILKEEEQRKEMTVEIKRHKIMILDSDDTTYNNLKQKMSYIYDFYHVETDGLAEGFIKKYGVPDLVIVDVDHRNFGNHEDLREKNRRMSAIVPIIVLGSQRDIQSISIFKQLGIQNYVLKPYSVIYLQSEIKRYLRAKN